MSKNAKKLTWEILSKDEAALSEDEKKLVADYNEVLSMREKELDEANNQLIEDCKIVTSGPESTMIPAYGWIWPVKKMVYAIEALNILYKKHRVYAVFDQIKEKYADFRGYYSIMTSNSRSFNFFMAPLDFLQKQLSKIDFKLQTIENSPGYDQEVWIERDPSNQHKLDSSSSATIAEEKILEKRVIAVPGKWEKVPNKHKLIFKLKNAVDKFHIWLSNKLDFLNSFSKEGEVFRRRLDDQVEDLVNECERECRKRCIRCGTFLDEDRDYYSTNGWYTYVCKKCASLSHGGLNACTDLSLTKKRNALHIFEKTLEKVLEDNIPNSSSELRIFLENLKRSKKSKDDEIDEDYEEDDDYLSL